MAAVVISFVVMLGSIGEAIGNLLEELPIARITPLDIARLSVYSLPTMAGFILPVTFLLGIMMTFGRMAQSSELTAAKAAGVPLRRLVLPVVAMGGALSVMCFVILDQGQPWAYRQINHLIGSEMPLRVTLDAAPTGVMHQYGDWRVYIERRTPDRTLHNVIVLQDQQDGVQAFYARSARVFRQAGVSRLEMEDVRRIEDDTVTTRVNSLTLTLPRLDSFARAESAEGWPFRRMLAEEQRLIAEYQQTNNFRISQSIYTLRTKIGDRFAFPLMCLAVSVVAAPVGARAQRSGRSYTFASGVLIIAGYFVLRSLVKDIYMPTNALAILVAQVPNLVLMAAGAVFIWRVDRI